MMIVFLRKDKRLMDLETIVVEETKENRSIRAKAFTISKRKPVDTPLIVPKVRGKGRPPKADLQAVKDRTKGKVGRPVGDTGRLMEFKERLLATGGTRILDKMISIALNDEHPGQMAAIKMSIDRLLPLSAFDASKNSNGSMPQISINITGLSSPSIQTLDDVSDITDV